MVPPIDRSGAEYRTNERKTNCQSKEVKTIPAANTDYRQTTPSPPGLHALRHPRGNEHEDYPPPDPCHRMAADVQLWHLPRSGIDGVVAHEQHPHPVRGTHGSPEPEQDADIQPAGAESDADPRSVEPEQAAGPSAARPEPAT